MSKPKEGPLVGLTLSDELTTKIVKRVYAGIQTEKDVAHNHVQEIVNAFIMEGIVLDEKLGQTKWANIWGLIEKMRQEGRHDSMALYQI